VVKFSTTVKRADALQRSQAAGRVAAEYIVADRKPRGRGVEAGRLRRAQSWNSLVLVETAFINNPVEVKLLKDPRSEEHGEALSSGVKEYFRPAPASRSARCWPEHAGVVARGVRRLANHNAPGDSIAGACTLRGGLALPIHRLDRAQERLRVATIGSNCPLELARAERLGCCGQDWTDTEILCHLIDVQNQQRLWLRTRTIPASTSLCVC